MSTNEGETEMTEQTYTREDMTRAVLDDVLNPEGEKNELPMA